MRLQKHPLARCVWLQKASPQAWGVAQQVHGVWRSRCMESGAAGGWGVAQRIKQIQMPLHAHGFHQWWHRAATTALPSSCYHHRAVTTALSSSCCHHRAASPPKTPQPSRRAEVVIPRSLVGPTRAMVDTISADDTQYCAVTCSGILNTVCCLGRHL